MSNLNVNEDQLRKEEAKACNEDAQGNEPLHDLNVEQWLVQQHQRAELSCPETQKHPRAIGKNGDHHNEQKVPSTIGDSRHRQESRSDASWNARATTARSNPSIDDGGFDNSFTFDSNTITDDGNADVFVAELAPCRNDTFVVQGERARSHLHISVLLSWIALALVLIIVVTVVAVQLNGSTQSNETSTITDTMVPVASPRTNTPTMPPSHPRAYGNVSMTIAEYFHSGDTYESIEISDGGKLFIEMLYRTDTEFTVFGVVSYANPVEEIDTSYLMKLVSPAWAGHVLDLLKGTTVEGQALKEEDMYDGMVLSSMAGYPSVIQLNPFRMNNMTIAETHRDLQFKNGVLHNQLHYPLQFAHWSGKSVLDVLLETNVKRDGDLSVFLRMIDQLPDIKSLLQEVGDHEAITLFAPTNYALNSADLQSIHGNQTREEAFVLNHLVSDNFARSCWWIIRADMNASDPERHLLSLAGHVLDLVLNDAVVISGYNATIIQEDVFAEQGIVHVIDKPLIHFESFNVII